MGVLGLAVDPPLLLRMSRGDMESTKTSRQVNPKPGMMVLECVSGEIVYSVPVRLGHVCPICERCPKDGQGLVQRGQVFMDCCE